MPFALKGVDAMIFSMFHSLHITVKLLAVLEGRQILVSATEYSDTWA